MTILAVKGSPFGINDEATSVELNILNDELPRCLDAVDGGSYTATAPISWNGFWTFAGAGNTVTFEAFALFDGASFNNVVTFNAPISVVAGSEFLSDAVFDGGVSILGLLSVDAGAPTPTFGSGLHVTGGTTTLAGTATAVNTTTLQVSAGTGTTFNGGVTHAITTGVVDHFAPVSYQTTAPIDQKSIITLNGPFGHVKWRRVNGSASNHTYAIGDADYIIVQVGTFAGPVIYTMSNTGCTGGEIIHVQCNDGGSFSLGVRQENGVTGIAILLTSTKLIGVTLMNNGSGSPSSGWDIVGYTTLP